MVASAWHPLIRFHVMRRDTPRRQSTYGGSHQVRHCHAAMSASLDIQTRKSNATENTARAGLKLA
jgi:hypothetical protein